MAAADVLGTVADRLVGGMMFHSDHADLCKWLGVMWLARHHENGYLHDSGCLRRVHRKGIEILGVMVPDGRQQRTHALDAFRSTARWNVKPDVRESALCDAMHDWCDWEHGTVELFGSSYRRLFDMGETSLAKMVMHAARDTEKELAGARSMLAEMEAVKWDMSHIMEMK